MKSGSLSAAAGELGMSRALVSRHLQQLEEEEYLGAKLFNRTTRKLSLTEVGAEYFGFCITMLAEFEEEESAIARLQNEPRGTLKIGASMAFGNLYLGPLVAEFIKPHPEIRLSFVLSDRPITPFDVIEKGFDLAICLHRIEDSTIVAQDRRGGLGDLCRAILSAAAWDATDARSAAHSCQARSPQYRSERCLAFRRSRRSLAHPDGGLADALA